MTSSHPHGWPGGPAQSSPAFRTVRRLMRRPAAVLACLLAAFAASACGARRPHEDGHGSNEKPGLGVKGSEPEAVPRPRLPGRRDEEHDAHSAAPTRSPTRPASRGRSSRRDARDRPGAVALVDARDWRAGVAGVGAGLDAGARRRSCCPTAPTCPAPRATRWPPCAPSGAKAAGGAQVIRVGDVARPAGLRTTDVAGRDPFALARALDAFSDARPAARSSDRGHHRLGRGPRLRDARRRVGGQVRRPGPLRPPQQRAPAETTRGAAGARPAAHLHPRAAERPSAPRRQRARQARAR